VHSKKHVVFIFFPRMDFHVPAHVTYLKKFQ
jgi:hypothetical protein